MTLLLLAAVLAGQVDAAGLSKLVAARQGKPVVVQLWASWCAPCLEEFPALEALARARPEVAFLSVSIDDESERGAVERLVRERQPPFPVYLKAPGADDAFIEGVDREWRGNVPALLVYDRAGRRKALLAGEHTRADIEKTLGPVR